MAKTISLSLPEDLAKWLEDRAKEKGVKIQEVIREAISVYKILVENKIDKLLGAYEDIVKALKKLSEIEK